MIQIGIQYIPVSKIRPNSYNPNVMPEDMLKKEMASIREFGFVDPMTVREMGDWYEVIDGEHRWRAAQRIGLEGVPCVVLDVDDDTARQLTVVLNDLRGKPNEDRLAELVRGLAEKRSMADLERVLPYKRERLAEMVAERRADFDWSALQRAPAEPKPVAERWVERVFRMPNAAADVVDDAIRSIRESESLDDDWRALEFMAADYLGGA